MKEINKQLHFDLQQKVNMNNEHQQKLQFTQQQYNKIYEELQTNKNISDEINDKFLVLKEKYGIVVEENNKHDVEK